MIKLVNINLETVSLKEQIRKIDEEDTEFIRAIMGEDDEHIIEEFWDTVQARLGLLEKIGIDANRVMEFYPKHLEKIKNRPRVKEG